MRVKDATSKGAYTPFSLRYQDEYRKHKFIIPMQARKDLIVLVRALNQLDDLAGRGTAPRMPTASKTAFNRLKTYYTPKSYHQQDSYEKTGRLRHFLLGTSPACVLDFVELYSQSLKLSNAEEEINGYLLRHQLPFKLFGRMIIPEYALLEGDEEALAAKRQDIQALLGRAKDLFEQKKYYAAMGTIWDAFENLKDYYSPMLSSQQTMTTLADAASQGKAAVASMLEDEMQVLNILGETLFLELSVTDEPARNQSVDLIYLYRRFRALMEMVLTFI